MKTYLLTLSLLLCTGDQLQASLVLGPSDVLDAAEAGQIETWLDQGPVGFTRIFSKAVDGSSANAFHANSNNQGPTVVVMSLTNGRKIGGYNPTDWQDSASGTFVTSGALDGFLFSLTSSTLYEQHGVNYGVDNQTFSRQSFGPTFGGGYDLFVNQSLTGGTVNLGFTYGDSTQAGAEPYRSTMTGSFDSWVIDDLEVFAISAIPEPTAAISLGALTLLLFGKRRRA